MCAEEVGGLWRRKGAEREGGAVVLIIVMVNRGE